MLVRGILILILAWSCPWNPEVRENGVAQMQGLYSATNLGEASCTPGNPETSGEPSFTV